MRDLIRMVILCVEVHGLDERRLLSRLIALFSEEGADDVVISISSSDGN